MTERRVSGIQPFAWSSLAFLSARFNSFSVKGTPSKPFEIERPRRRSKTSQSLRTWEARLRIRLIRDRQRPVGRLAKAVPVRGMVFSKVANQERNFRESGKPTYRERISAVEGFSVSPLRIKQQSFSPMRRVFFLGSPTGPKPV